MVAEVGDDGGEFALELFPRGGVGDEAEGFVGERFGGGVRLEKFAGDFAAGETLGGRGLSYPRDQTPDLGAQCGA